MKLFSARSFLVIGCVFTLMVGASASAADCIKNPDGNVVCGEGQCAMDQYGKVLCAKAGGGAIRDQNGNVKCGVGFCAPDDTGEVKCSAKPGGGAAADSNGKVKCLGGCQTGSQQRCAPAR